MTSDDNNADSARTSAGTGPNDKTDLFPPPTKGAAAHAWSKEDPETEPLRQSWGRTWSRAAVLLTGTAVVALGIGVAGWVMLRKHDDATAHRPLANPPTSWAAPPAPPNPAWMPSTTAQLTTAAMPGTDDLGWTEYPSARCDPGTQPAAMARTTQSVVVVCQIQAGNFYYRGVRLSDGASIELPNAVRSSGGFDVTNPTDGTRYRITPTTLTITPPEGQACSEPMLEYASS
jgi:hypothetical protein